MGNLSSRAATSGIHMKLILDRLAETVYQLEGGDQTDE